MVAGRMVVGRAEELARLERLRSDLLAGDGRALLVHGEAGIGKTTLLDVLVERCASEVTVVRARGVQTEAEIAFAGLSDLLKPLVGELGKLPDPQAAALAGALALGPPQPGDRLAVCVATLGLLHAAGRGRPVLAVVDDLQWLDAPSRECMLFAARRAGGPVAFVLASRDENGDGDEHTDLPELRLGRLAREDADAVLADTAPDLAAPVARAVADAAAGNPLALVELPAALSGEQRAGVTDLAMPLAPGARLRAAYARRVAALGGQARQALLVAAAYDGEDLRTLAAACGQAATDGGLLVQAEERGLVRIQNERVVFAHPLIRGAVSQSATVQQRRAAHRALAGVLVGEQRAWHLAAAAVGPDEPVAAELERAAGAAAARRGFASAAAALERSARLSPDTQAFARRMLAAGQAALAAGRPDRALGLLAEAAGATTDTSVAAQAEHLRGKAIRWRGQAHSAIELLEAEAHVAAAHDPRQAAAMLADAAAASTTVGACHRALIMAERAAALLEDGDDPEVRAHVLAVLGWALIRRGQTARAREPLAEAERLAATLDPLSPAAPPMLFGLSLRLNTGEFERAYATSKAICERARQAGAVGTLPIPLLVVAESAWRLGDWASAAAAADESIRMAEDAGHPTMRGQAWALVLRARLAAVAGREDASRGDLRAALAIAEATGLGNQLLFVTAAVGFLELGLERVDQAVTALERAERLATEQGLEEPTLVPWAPDLIEAYLRAGQAQDARRVLATLRRQAAQLGSAPARAAAARCRGLLDADFDTAFTEALDLDDERPMPFERARTLLAYGRRLQRVRRRADAREQLREALTGFERLGAAAWATQARNELRAAGARRRAPRPDELTPQEQRVAAAVARGASNREAAAELFLAPKTVEFHLSQIYRKLGVTSRTQLVAALAREPTPRVPPTPDPRPQPASEG